LPIIAVARACRMATKVVNKFLIQSVADFRVFWTGGVIHR
jgi:hypothetical protein